MSTPVKPFTLTDEERELVTNNHNLIYSYLNKFHLTDDYYDLCAIGLCRAAHFYKPENGKFSVYAFVCMSNIINMDDGAARNDIYEGITTSVDTLAANYGIKVEDVKIKRFDLPEANESAVYARMISERQQIAEKYTADGNYEASLIRNDVDKQVNIIVSNAEAEAAKLQAEGEAEYMRLLGKAYNTEDKQEFYKFTQALEALKSTLNGDEKTIILGKDSDLAQILMNP